MVLNAVDGGGVLDIPPALPPPRPEPPLPAPTPTPAPPPPSIPPASAPGQGAAPVRPGAQSEPAGVPGGEPNPTPPPPSGRTTPPPPPGEGGSTGGDGSEAGGETADAALGTERILEAARKKKTPPGVGQTWRLLLGEVFTGPPLSHTQLQGTNDSVIDLLKVTPRISVNVPDHPTVL